VQRETNIVVTIGPASEGRAQLTRLAKAGMNVARLNFSHGDYAEMERIVRDVRTVSKATGKRISIMQDLSGPKLRVGEIAPGTRYRRGQEVTVTTRNVIGGPAVIPISYRKLPAEVRAGDTLLLKDGEIELHVLRSRRGKIVARVAQGGELRSHQGLNVPTASLSIPALTPKDRRDLAWGLDHGVDWVAISFVKSAADVKQLKRLIAKELPTGKRPKVVAKIEKHEAVTDLDSIITEADGVMVARGDLGVETDAAEVPFIQKEIINRANRAGKPVITATQMLESMVEHVRPTRAEVSDVANAVLDGTDAVMLSEESAVGEHPVEAVRIMRRVVEDAERHLRRRRRAGLL
jgi:pyruvate kinase